MSADRSMLRVGNASWRRWSTRRNCVKAPRLSCALRRPRRSTRVSGRRPHR